MLQLVLVTGQRGCLSLSQTLRREGICISRKVCEEITGKMQLAFVDLGERQLKNIAPPVRVYRISGEQLVVARASVKLDLALPDKPSIAVLPFTNMSGDPEQEYFADGMVEEIITALSRIRWLFVIARNSSFTYKGRAVDVKRVCRELGVLYVLEGSVRKAGNRRRHRVPTAIANRHLNLMWVMGSRENPALAASLDPQIAAEAVAPSKLPPSATTGPMLLPAGKQSIARPIEGATLRKPMRTLKSSQRDRRLASLITRRAVALLALRWP
jgi:TolB-like protein